VNVPMPSELRSGKLLFQYLFKYIYKGASIIDIIEDTMADHVISSGSDHAKYRIHSGDNNEDPIDEIEDYWKA
jgi:hypothetical protein